MLLTEELRRVPFVKLIIPFIAGILIQINFFVSFPFFMETATILLLILTIINLIKPISSSFKFRYIFGIATYCLLFLLGVNQVDWAGNATNELDILNKKEGVIIANVIEDPQEKDKSYKAVLDVIAIKSKDQWIAADGNTVVYFEKDSSAKKIKLGDQLLFEPNFTDIKSNNNPGEFDYKKYMAFRLISKQTYLKSNNWKLIKNKQGNELVVFTSGFRDKLLSIFRANGLSGNEFAVASALILGYKDKIDENILKAYSASGAMHVLSVSGMHVGIIYVVLNYLLSFFNKIKMGGFLKALILLATLWFYTLLSGLSPCILRAAIMLSFVVVGESLKRKPSIYNTLSVSAFILLLINPYFIMDIGFQLSYLAVLGIVMFQQRFYKLLEVKNWFLDKIWSLISVSLAAQLATTPVTLYYFHQFPNYFLLTNVVVVPFATIVMYMAILLFFISYIDPLASFLGEYLSYSVKLLNGGVMYIEQLPYSIVPNISVSGYQVLILYSSMIFFTVFFIFKKNKFIHLGLMSIILVLGIQIYRNYYSTMQKKFFVYNIKGISAFNFIDGSDNILFSDIPQDNIQQKVNFHIKNNWLTLGLENEKIIDLKKLNTKFLFSNLLTTDNVRLFYKNEFIQFYKTKIVIIRDEQFANNLPNQKLKVDYVILSNNVRMPLHKIMEMYQFKKIIIDSSNSNRTKNKFIDECANMNINFYSVPDNGAFQVDI